MRIDTNNMTAAWSCRSVKTAETGKNHNVNSKSDNKFPSSRPEIPLLHLSSLMTPKLDGTHLRNINRYVEDIRDMLKENGIDLSDGISLSVGTDGRITVNGSHPDKEKIENLINGKKELSEKLKNEMIMQQHSEAMKKSLEFQKMYAVNPQMAVARYSYLFDNNYSIEAVLEITRNSSSLNVNMRLNS